MTREKLIGAAKDLNETLGLEPPIDTMWETEDIEGAVKMAGQLVEPTDELQEETWSVLKLLGLSFEQESEKKKNAVEKSSSKEKEKSSKPVARKSSTEESKAPLPIKEVYCREYSVFDALQKAYPNFLPLEEIAAKADKLYTRQGGKSNPNQSVRVVKLALKHFLYAKVVELKEGKYRLCK